MKRISSTAFVLALAFVVAGCVTPIHREAQEGSLPGVRTELEEGAAIDARDQWDKTPLILAAEGDHTELALYLIESGADVNAAAHEQIGEVTALRAAIDNRNFELVRRLVAAGADVNHANTRGWTPLMTAARVGDDIILDYLIEQGADITARTESGRTAARVASEAGYTDIVFRLTRLEDELATQDGDAAADQPGTASEE